MNKVQLPTSQDHWIATVIWLVLLILLILATTGMFLPISSYTAYLPILSSAGRTPPIWLPITMIAAALVSVILILIAWSRFFRFSKRLFLSLGKTFEGRETGSIFYSFLSFPVRSGTDENTSELPVQAEEATGTIVSQIIWLVALSYLFAVIEIGIILASTYFLR